MPDDGTNLNRSSGIYSEPRPRLVNWKSTTKGGTPMKSLVTTLTAALLAASFAVTAEAATKKSRDANVAQREASCKAQAAKKYSAVRFLARRDFVNRCMEGQVVTKKKMKAKKTKAA
jgi:hypothetical protein